MNDFLTEDGPVPGYDEDGNALCPAGFSYADGHDCPAVHEPDDEFEATAQSGRGAEGSTDE